MLLFYCSLILFYWSGWRSIKPYTSSKNDLLVSISVIIPARNEEKNIGHLLSSLEKQTYPKNLFEVIVIDDHSDDRTVEVVKKFPDVTLLKLGEENINSYKKKAIETGIDLAKGDLIVTTDADCIVPENWLKTIASFKFEQNAKFIAAPVLIQHDSSVLQTFQFFDFMVLQGITASSVSKRIHSMCNGANLAYEKETFYDVNGFKDIDHIASGDDMLLMEKISKQHPDKVFFLLADQAIVFTQPAFTWKEFFQQRIRWASKATTYSDIKIFSALFIVYFFNCSLLALFIAGFWQHDLWLVLIGFFLIKTIVELIFLIPIATFFKKKDQLYLFPLFQPLHIIYTIIAGWLGTFGSFEWKGRRVK